MVSPVESDQFDVFNHLYVENSASVVTGHGSSWQKIRAKPKVTADGRKAETPSKFDMAFVWDEGHQLGNSFGPNGTYPTSSTLRMCADEHFSDPYRTSACHLQTSKSSQYLPASTGLCRMIHFTPSPRSDFSPVHCHPFDAQPSAQCIGDQC